MFLYIEQEQVTVVHYHLFGIFGTVVKIFIRGGNQVLSWPAMTPL